jgi:hypothetical protein
MSDDRRIISVGNWWEWPPSMWGSRDRAQAAQLDVGQQELGKTPRSPALTQPPSLPPGFTLHPKKSTARDARGRAIDKLLDSLGVQSKRRAR